MGAAIVVLLCISATPEVARVAIDIARTDLGEPWFAEALGQMLEQELTRFSRVAVVDEEKDAEVIVRARLRGSRLEYEVYETWTPSRASRGGIVVQGINRSRLQQRVAEIVRPIVQSGGLLDRRPSAQAPSARGFAWPALGERGGWVALVLALLLVWPVLVLRLAAPRAALSKQPRPASWPWTTGAVLLLAIAAGIPAWPVTLPPIGATGALIVPLGGGLLWGVFLWLNLVFVLAPIPGLSHIGHEALRPLLRAWLGFALLRAFAVLALYAPVFMLTLLGARTLGIDGRLVFLWLLPASGMFAWFWLLTLADNLATYLDAVLVDGVASTRNPWHATMRKYFMGYVRRGGLVLDRQTLERALYLPSKLPGVVCYGGGFGRPRILVGEKVREAALSELPDEPEAPERTVNPEELPWGFMVAEDAPENRRALDRAEARRKALVRAPARGRVPMPRLLGESATALGWVVPPPRDETVPLISNTREDYEVVKSLLTEHYAGFERNLGDDEHDDTDPTQKDFLFAALLGAIGRIERGEAPLHSLRLALDAGLQHASWLSRRAVGTAAAIYDRLLSWPGAMVADAFVALNGALHPMIQYLSLLRSGDASGLSARADAPLLIRESKRLLEALAKERPVGDDRHMFRATLRSRLLWLSRFFHAPLVPPPLPWRRAIIAAFVFGLCAAFVNGVVRDAIDYHPVYSARMAEMQAKAESGGNDVRSEEQR